MNLPGDPYMGHGATWAPGEIDESGCRVCEECGGKLSDRHEVCICDACVSDIADDDRRGMICRVNSIEGLLRGERRLLIAGATRVPGEGWIVPGETEPVRYMEAREKLGL